MDSRVERYRQARLMKRRFRLVILLSFFILVAGVCVVDYSVNALVRNERKISVISFSKYDEHRYTASFFNKTFLIDTGKISRDLSGLKRKAAEVISDIRLF